MHIMNYRPFVLQRSSRVKGKRGRKETGYDDIYSRLAFFSKWFCSSRNGENKETMILSRIYLFVNTYVIIFQIRMHVIDPWNRGEETVFSQWKLGSRGRFNQ